MLWKDTPLLLSFLAPHPTMQQLLTMFIVAAYRQACSRHGVDIQPEVGQDRLRMADSFFAGNWHEMDLLDAGGP